MKELVDSPSRSDAEIVQLTLASLMSTRDMTCCEKEIVYVSKGKSHED